jgi:photosystem II stability/assembly factor-like uncharacterized protein
MFRLVVSFLTAIIVVGAVTPRTFAQTIAPKFLAFAFASNEHGWAGGGDGIAVTDDGGRTWRSQFHGRRVDQLVIVRRRANRLQLRS